MPANLAQFLFSNSNFLAIEASWRSLVITYKELKRTFLGTFTQCLLYEMPIKNIFMGAKPRNFKKVINFV